MYNPSWIHQELRRRAIRVSSSQVSNSIVVSAHVQDANVDMEMRVENHSDYVSLVNMLKSCGKNKDLRKGRRLHDDILRKGLLGKNPYVASSLVNMYAKCGSLTKAQELLDELLVRDVISWSALITGYVQHGRSQDALKWFRQMKDEGLSPDSVTYICILKACSSVSLEIGEDIHAKVRKRGLLQKDLILGNALVDMYGKCGLLEKAREVFEDLPVQDVVSWNALIGGYVEHGHEEEALSCLTEMMRKNFSPDPVTYVRGLQACSSLGSRVRGDAFHAEIVKRGLETDYLIGNTLVDFYCNCDALLEAEEVFDEIPVRNVVTWNALITGHVQHGHGTASEKAGPDPGAHSGGRPVCGGAYARAWVQCRRGTVGPCGPVRLRHHR